MTTVIHRYDNPLQISDLQKGCWRVILIMLKLVQCTTHTPVHMRCQKKGTLPLPPTDVCVGGSRSKFFWNPAGEVR
jgi:hypothetical protein